MGAVVPAFGACIVFFRSTIRSMSVFLFTVAGSGLEAGCFAPEETVTSGALLVLSADLDLSGFVEVALLVADDDC